MRKLFFSFHYDNDIHEVMNIRNSWRFTAGNETQPFVDKAEFESIKRNPSKLKEWIDNQMVGTSVTVVLIGTETYQREWVRYEIEQSHKLNKGMIGISLSGMKRLSGNIYPHGANSPFNYVQLPDAYGNQVNYPIYNWITGDGRNHISEWAEKAAMEAQSRKQTRTMRGLLGF